MTEVHGSLQTEVFTNDSLEIDLENLGFMMLYDSRSYCGVVLSDTTYIITLLIHISFGNTPFLQV